MKLETFLSYRNYRWFWISLASLIVLTVVYIFVRPVTGPSGSTAVGYTYGTLAALGILYLTWFGIRKRSYYTSKISLKAVLSAHVWIGVALAFLVPLHCGFSFGWNVHTLAYVLMMTVILSGVWGAIQYVKLPGEIQSHRGGATVKRLIQEFEKSSAQIRESGDGKSDNFLRLIKAVEYTERPNVCKALLGFRPKEISSQEIAPVLSALAENEHADGLKLLALAKKNRDLAKLLLDEVAILAKLRIWLYFHLPVSIALLGALFIHIFSVFYFF